MASIYTHRDTNVRKTWLLFTAFFIIVIGIGWAISYAYNSPNILVIAVIFSTLMSFFSYWYSDKLVLKLTRAKPVTKEQSPELYNIIENLSITAGLPMPRLYMVDDPVPNAFATGRDAKHAVVAATSGLLEVLDRSELEGVLAHELSHIGNRDMLVSTFAVILVGFISLLSDWFLRSMWWGGHRENNRGRAGAILMLAGIILAILAPIIATLMQLAISRKREFLADASGALLTRYPEGLAGALRKIDAHARPMKSINNATAHLWLSDPHGKKINGVAKLFMTHPSIEDRVKALTQMSV